MLKFTMLSLTYFKNEGQYQILEKPWHRLQIRKFSSNLPIFFY